MTIHPLFTIVHPSNNLKNMHLSFVHMNIHLSGGVLFKLEGQSVHSLFLSKCQNNTFFFFNLLVVSAA